MLCTPHIFTASSFCTTPNTQQVKDTVAALGLENRWRAVLADLVPHDIASDGSQDLIVFNPPWFPVPSEGVDASATPTPTPNAEHARVQDELVSSVAMDSVAVGNIHANGSAAAAQASSAGSEHVCDDDTDYTSRTVELAEGGHWLEAASYRDAGLMPRFFNDAHRALRVGGEVCVVYVSAITRPIPLVQVRECFASV